MTSKVRAIRKVGAMNLIELREAQRFKVDWTIKVSALGVVGPTWEETGILRDISSTGAYGLFTSRFEMGRSVKVTIRLPLERAGWISYPARVLRVEPWGSGVGIAFIFGALRPSFVADD